MGERKTPSKGGKPDKLMRDALILELKREAQDANGQKTQKLYLVARKLVDEAIDGNVMAIKEINDRTDGKAMQGVELSGPDGAPIPVQRIELVAPDDHGSG